MSNDWIEHNGGHQPVADDVCVEVDEGHVEYLVGPARDFDWSREEWFRWRILNQHLIDAARLEGIRLGLEAARQAIETIYDPQADDILEALDPETIAKEAQRD